MYRRLEFNTMVCEECVGSNGAMCVDCERLFFGNPGENEEAINHAGNDHHDTTTEEPHTAMPPRDVDSLSPSHPQGLRLQTIGQQTLDNCCICGGFVPTLWRCKYCLKPTCRHPQCVSPLDSNVCANHIVCQICLDRPSFSECLMCRLHYCPECAADNALPLQEASETEICGECEHLYDDPWDERYDEDGNYIFGMGDSAECEHLDTEGAAERER